MVFNKIDNYSPDSYDKDDLIYEKTSKNYTIKEWESTWMSKTNNEAIFISALNNDNIDTFKTLFMKK